MHQHQNALTTHEPQHRSPERSGEHDFSSRVTTLSNLAGHSEQYGQLRSQGATHSEAFSEAAHLLATQKQSLQSGETLSSADKALLEVIGQLGIFVDAKQEHDAIVHGGDSRYLGRDDKDQLRSLKETHLIPFNHLVKELINTHPEENIRDVTTQLTRAHAALFSKYNNLHPSKPKQPHTIVQPKEVAYEIEAIIDGMRHEVAGEALVQVAGHLFNHDVSASQDRRGTDGIITIEKQGKDKYILVDFKASAASAERAQNEHSFSNAVWTGLGWEDFTGRKGTHPGALSVPYDTLLQHADAFMNRVFAMDARNAILRNQVRQKTAQAALAG